MRISSNLAKCVPKPKWRESSSVILVHQQQQPKTLNYLMLQRSSKMKFMANGLCFPGGGCDTSDSSLRWLKIFKDYAGTDLNNLNFLSKSAHRPPIYTVEESERIPKEISLRITGIRETFEECGILLCKKDKNDKNENFNILSGMDDIKKWQKKMKTEPDGFLEFCDFYKCFPDIFSLFDWSNWLTPSIFNQNYRFDTIFYVKILHSLPLPLISNDEDEIARAEWSNAKDLIKRHFEKKLRLLPPQIYELSRLTNVHDLSVLQELLEIRKKDGLERTLPLILNTPDGELNIFAGDDLYEEVIQKLNPNISDLPALKMDENYEQLRSRCTNFHRREENGDETQFLLVNIPYRYGQKY